MGTSPSLRLPPMATLRSREGDPMVLGVVKVAADASTVPMVLKMTPLDGQPDRFGPESAHALPARAAHARVDDAVAAPCPQPAAEHAARLVAVRIEQRRPSRIVAAQ